MHETRQRNAELALIRGVQEAIAQELEPQAIYDLVGDRLQEVFDAQVVDIAVYDETAGLLRFPYAIERGVRFPDEPMELMGYRKHVMELGEPLLINEDSTAASGRYGNPEVLAGEPAKSFLFVPLLVGGRAIGVISLQNLDREHAFSDSDVSLLTTLVRQPQRRAPECTPSARDAPAECRTGVDQQRAGVNRRRAGSASDLRHRGREVRKCSAPRS